MAGLIVDRYDSRCALCRNAEADKTGSHLAPNFMIHGMFSFDGKGRRNREIAMRDGLNSGNRMIYYGPEVSPDAINADHGEDLTDEELEGNTNHLVCDNLFCKRCEDRFGILETYYSSYYAEWKHEEVNSRVAYLFWLSVFWRMCVGRMSIFLMGEDEFEMRRILDENITTLEEIEKGNSVLGDFGYILWRTKGLQKGDSGVFGTRKEHSPYMIIINDMVVLLVAGVSKFRKSFSYAGWQINREDYNTFDCDGEVVNEISLEEFALLKRFVIDESEKYGWGPAQEQVKLEMRELDRTAGELHSIGYNEEREALRIAMVEDEMKPRPFFLRNMSKFLTAELKEYACNQAGKEYNILKDRSMFMFQFDIDNYKSDLKMYVREGEDISGFPYVDKLFDKKYWEGKEAYQKKLEILKESYEELVAKGYTFDDFMNNLRSRSGMNC